MTPSLRPFVASSLSTLSTPDQTAIEPPSITFCGLRIFHRRNGDLVTGRVEFPEDNRPPADINYHNRTASIIPHEDAAAGRLLVRLMTVQEYHRLIEANPGVSRSRLAARAGSTCNGKAVSTRSVQLWVHNYELHGTAGLRDKYHAPPKKTLQLPGDVAADCVRIAAWWIYRIDKCPTCTRLSRVASARAKRSTSRPPREHAHVVDYRMIATAASLLDQSPVADVIATIDRYYTWPCDRERYRFKPFARWGKHDYTTWLHRATESADAARVKRQAHARAKQANNHYTRSAIKQLATQSEPQAPARGWASDEATKPRRDEGTKPRPSVAPSLSPATALRDARRLEALGNRKAADRHLAKAIFPPSLRPSVATSLPPLSANDNPQTIAESMQLLDDRYRMMLHQAADGDHNQFQNAVATIELWWPSMPEQLRNNIDFKIEAWARNHRRSASPDVLAKRRILMLVRQLRAQHSGTRNLRTALRLPT